MPEIRSACQWRWRHRKPLISEQKDSQLSSLRLPRQYHREEHNLPHGIA